MSKIWLTVNILVDGN